MHQLTKALALLVLAACTSSPPVTVQAFRQPAAPIYSAVSLDPGALSGRWTEVAAFQPDGGTCRKGGGMNIARASVDYRLCIGGRMVKGKGPLRQIGPGRFALPGLTQPVWVLWVDGDHRTLVLGTPQGNFGLVLDRGSLTPDRENAAREILDWNGYNLEFYRRF